MGFVVLLLLFFVSNPNSLLTLKKVRTIPIKSQISGVSRKKKEEEEVIWQYNVDEITSLNSVGITERGQPLLSSGCLG